MNDFLVTLYKSDNTYLTYPVNGRITILETGTDGRIIRAIFQMNSGGPVVVDHPDFEYPAEERARWFSEYGDIQNAAIAAAVQSEREACANVEPGMDTSGILGWDKMTPDERRMWKAGYGCAMVDFAAAIRARNGAGRK